MILRNWTQTSSRTPWDLWSRCWRIQAPGMVHGGLGMDSCWWLLMSFWTSFWPPVILGQQPREALKRALGTKTPRFTRFRAHSRFKIISCSKWWLSLAPTVVGRLEEESGGWVSWFIRRNWDMLSENWTWRGVILRNFFQEEDEDVRNT